MPRADVGLHSGKERNNFHNIMVKIKGCLLHFFCQRRFKNLNILKYFKTYVASIVRYFDAVGNTIAPAVSEANANLLGNNLKFKKGTSKSNTKADFARQLILDTDCD